MKLKKKNYLNPKCNNKKIFYFSKIVSKIKILCIVHKILNFFYEYQYYVKKKTNLLTGSKC